MGRLYRLSLVCALILIFAGSIRAAPKMEWGLMVGNSGAPAHYRKDDGLRVDFTVILKVTGDTSVKADTFAASLSLASGFDFPAGETSVKTIKNLYPNQVKYLYWNIKPPGTTMTVANALTMNASYWVSGIKYDLSAITRNMNVEESFSTPQFQVTNNIVGDLLPGGYVEVVQSVTISGGNNNRLAWGNFFDRYDVVKLVDIKSNVPFHSDPQTYSPYAAPLGTYEITYKFYIEPNAPTNVISLNNYFLGDTGTQWRTQDSQTLGTGIGSWVVYPQGFQGTVTECRSGIGAPGIPVSVYRMDNTLYDSRPATLSNGSYAFGVKDDGIYKLYFNDPADADFDSAYSSFLDDNGGAGYSISNGTIYTVNTCLYHYTSGAIYFDSSIYRDGDTVKVTVEDHDLNPDPNVKDTVNIILNSTAGDSENLTLTEVLPDVSVFEGTISADIAAYVRWDGTLQGANANTVTARYYDLKDYLGGASYQYAYAALYATTTSDLRFTDASFADASGYAVGNTVYIQLTDFDENENPAAVETVSVTVYNNDHTDTETALLTETGTATGIFRGSLPLDYKPASPGNSTVNADPGQVIYAFYSDNNDPTDTDIDSASIVAKTASAVYFTDFVARAYKYIAGEDTANIYLSDADRNLSNTVKEKLSVVITNSSDTETMNLLETSVASGIFTNTLPMTIGDFAGTSYDGTLNQPVDGALTVLYVDGNDGADTATDTVQCVIPSSASVAFLDSLGASATYYIIGKNIFIEVNDPDQNKNPLSAENLSVSVSASVSGDAETAVLSETGTDSGIFRNMIGLPLTEGSSSNGNGTLEASDPDTVTASYTDPTDPADNVQISVPVWSNAFSSSIYFTNSSKISVTGYIAGNPVYILISDMNLNIDAGKIDTGTCVVFNDTGTDSESVVLYETSSNSGIFFSGGLVSKTGASVPWDGSISFNNGGFIFARYTDPYDASDTALDSAYTVIKADSTFTTTDDDLNPASVFLIGQDIHVLVTDGNVNLDPYSAEAVYVIIINAVAGDTETFVLTETGPSSGIFYGYISSDGGPSYTENGKLSAYNNQICALSYSDPYDAADISGGEVLFKMPTNASIYTTDVTGLVVKDLFYAGDKIFIKAEDTDRNRDLSTQDQIEMTIHSTVKNDTETVILHETAVSSGTFFLSEGIGTQRATASIENGVLEVANSDTIVVRYSDIYEDADISYAYAFIAEASSRVKTLHFHDLICDTFTGTNTMSTSVASLSWTQTPAFREDFYISGLLTGTFFISSAADITAYYTVERVLPGGTAQTIASSANFSVSPSNISYAVSVFPSVNSIREGEKLKVSLYLSAPATVYYNSPLRDSRLDLPTTTFVNIPEAGAFRSDYASDPSGSSISGSFYIGQDIFFRQTITDPFGSQDILDSNGALLYSPSLGFNNDLMTLAYDSGYDAKIYGSAANTTTEGLYDVLFTAVESNGVTDSYALQIAVTSTVSSINTTDGSGITTDRYPLLDTIYIVLTDRDKNLTFSNDTVAVTVADAISGDIETVVLTETSNDGIFRGSIVTGVTPASSGNGILETSIGNTVQISYTDIYKPSETCSRTVYIIDHTSSTLEILDSAMTSKSSFMPNENFYSRLTDADRNLNSLLQNTVTVTAVSVIRGDTETFTLTETSAASGVFLSSLLKFSRTASSPEDGILGISSPDTVVFTYTDASDPADTSSVTVSIISSNLGVLSLDKSAYYETESVNISLWDPDLNTSAVLAETVEIWISSQSGDTEKVLLTELSSDSETFTGSISVPENEMPSVFTLYDGTLHCSGYTGANTISAVYYDEASPSPSTVAVETSALFSGTAKYQIFKEREFPARAQGERQNYTISLRNYSTTPSGAVSLLDKIPLNTVYTAGSASDGGALIGETVTWSIANLDPSATFSTRTFSVDVDIAAPDSTTVDNIALVRDASKTVYASAVSFIVGKFPELVFSLVNDTPDPVNAGNSITYTMAVENIGNTAAKNMLVSASVPPLTSYLSGGTLSVDTVVFSVALLPAGSSDTFVYSVLTDLPIANGTVIEQNAFTTADNSPRVNSGVTGTTVISSPSLEIIKTQDIIYAYYGDTVTYSLTLRNNGNENAADITLEDSVPFNTLFQNATGGGTLSGGKVTWTVPALNAASEITVSFSVTVSLTAGEGEEIYNQARAKESAESLWAYSNSVYFEVRRYPYLTIDKYALSGTIYAGETVTYKIVIRNDGSDAASGITFTDALPALFSVSSADFTYTQSGQNISWALASLPEDAGNTYTLTLVSDISIPNNTLATNGVTANASYGNSSYDECDVIVLNSAVLMLSLTAPSSINCGESFVYYISYRNDGADPLTGLVIYDTVPYPLSYVSGGSFDGTKVSFNIGNVPAYSPADTVSYTVTAPAVFTNGYIVNDRAYAYSNEIPYAGSNPVSTTIVSAPEMNVSKTVNLTSASAGDTLLYTLIAENTGSDTAFNIVASDVLSVYLQYVSGADWTSGNTVYIDFGDLAAGAMSARSFTVMVSTATASNSIINNSALFTGDNFTNRSTNFVQTLIGVYPDPAVLTVTRTVSSFAIGDTSVFTVTVGNPGDTGSASFYLYIDVPDYFSIADAGSGTVTGQTITYNEAALPASGSRGETFTISYENASSHVKDTDNVVAYLGVPFTQKTTSNDTKLSSVTLLNDTYDIAVFNSKNAQCRTLMPETIFRSGMEADISLSGTVISPNYDGYKDTVDVFFNAVTINFDGIDDSGDILPDGEYYVRLRVQYASGSEVMVKENLLINAAPDKIIQNLRLYPNPAKDTMRIAYSPNYAADVTVHIYDVAGNSVQKLVNTDKDDEEIVWLLDNKTGKKVASGIYFIVISAEYEGKKESYEPLKGAVIK